MRIIKLREDKDQFVLQCDGRKKGGERLNMNRIKKERCVETELHREQEIRQVSRRRTNCPS